jgi:predicted ATPase
MHIKKISANNLGPIKQGEVEFGDLTLFMGPQATGKSILLQHFKLLNDYKYIYKYLLNKGFSLKTEDEFLQGYLGENMHNVWNDNTILTFTEAGKIAKNQFSIKNNIIDKRIRYSKDTEKSTCFYIPAQRVLIYDQDGWVKDYGGYPFSCPFVIKEFSETIRQYITSDEKGDLFPKKNLKGEIKDLIDKHMFRGAKLKKERISGLKNRFVLDLKQDAGSIPFVSWSAGQREFIPLLLGLYYLLPAARTEKLKDIDYVIIEELEMGLHPDAITAVMFAIFELIQRGYKVIISTHSVHVVEIVWAMKNLLKSANGNFIKGFADIFSQNSKSSVIKDISENLYNKSYKVYFFNPLNGAVTIEDISSLDTLDEKTAGWGGISSASAKINDIVSRY